jgi:hypothetical protein
VWGPRPRGAQPPERRRGLGPAAFTRAVRRQHPGKRAIDAEDQGHRGIHPKGLTTIDGLPLTTVARTLVDLTATLTPHQTERVVHRGQHLRLLDTRSLDEQLARAQGRPTRKLRAAVATLAMAEPDITRTELEERFLALVLDARLPRPEVNAAVGPYEVDFL